MATRREIVDAALFFPGMVLIGAVIFGGAYAVIVFGGWTLKALYAALRFGVHLPHSASLALSVILAALVVFAVVPRAIGWLGRLVNRARKP